MEEQSGHVLSEGPPSLISLRRGSVSAECLEPLAIPIHSVSTTSKKNEIERHQIEEAVTGNLLFKDLDRYQLDVIIDAMVPRSVEKNEAVFCQGDPGDFFYVVASGHFFVMIDKEKRADIVPGPRGSFGELALLYNCPRTATLVAGEDSKLWAVDRLTFRTIIARYNYDKRRLHESFLRSVPLLSALDDTEISKIADALKSENFCSTEIVVRQGDSGDKFYFIVQGSAEVLVDEKTVGHLGSGEYFGERALLTFEQRQATVLATTSLHCLALDASSFTRLLGPLLDILNRTPGSD